MRLPVTLAVYIGRQFLMLILMALLGLTFVSLLIDTIELIRRAADRSDVPFGAIVQMALLKSPNMAERMAPFAVLIGSILALTKLTRSQELVVARAAGVSVWQFLLPALGVVAGLGLFMSTIFNPLASVMLLKFEKVEAKYLTGQPSLLAVSSSGLWLRQVERADPRIGEHIIYSQRISQADMSFSNVIVFAFDKENRFIERLDAQRAQLSPSLLELSDVTRSVPGLPAESISSLQLPTNLKIAQIQNSFAAPETLSFWRLPSFVRMLERAGFSALKHRLYWHSLLASPLLLCGMVLIAAIFSLRLPRLGKIGMLVVSGIITGFFLHFFTDIVNALGMAGTVPVVLAAWAPALIIVMIGAATLLHLEDG